VERESEKKGSGKDGKDSGELHQENLVELAMRDVHLTVVKAASI
jgi:hypothetical protein